MTTRKSGILLHPTSLPAKYGIGDMGDTAHRFVEFLTESGQSLWQVLPLSPAGYGDSPYNAYSSMAGNPLLISPEILVREGLLGEAELGAAPDFSATAVDYPAAASFKNRILKLAGKAFFTTGTAERQEEFEQFCRQKAFWLDKFAEFAALKEENGGTAWTEWHRREDPDENNVRIHKFIQFEFFRQWRSLKEHCNGRGIQIIGDIPIFVAHDSADVWSHPELFDLDETGRPRTVAGVPPDYFSETGQLWGNPLYRWDVMEQTGYRWWIRRVESMLEFFDIIRIDHFRGFEKYYEIPGNSKTAANGRWVEGPGDRLFEALNRAFHKIPFIAEDLGYITPEVHELRDRWHIPGMRVLQFAFGNEGQSDSFKPYNFIRNCVVYTGTHDNDTTLGWFTGTNQKDSTRTADQVKAERDFAMRYLNSDGTEIHWDFIRAALSSVAEIALFPLQDVLGLGSEARMNLPSRPENNWRWRFQSDQLLPELSARLKQLTRTYGRMPD